MDLTDSVSFVKEVAPSVISSRFVRSLKNYKGAFFVSDDQIYFSIAVDIDGHHLAADARIAVDQVGNKVDFAVFARQLKPVEHSRFARTWIAEVMRPVALSSDDVFEPVAIDYLAVYFLVMVKKTGGAL